MNETPGIPPSKIHPVDDSYPAQYPDGWERPRHATRPISGHRRGEYLPPPVGPGIFLLPFAVPEWVKTLEVCYSFEAGREAAIQAAEVGAPIYRICAPNGCVLIPVGAVREWGLELPPGTSATVYLEKWQVDSGKMARRQPPALTDADLDHGARLLAGMRARRGQ
jgi:hypothetical protein